MSLKKSAGQMYDWVTHTHAHLGGECPHKCSYCYVDNPRFGRSPKYTGEVRLLEGEMNVHYGEGKTIFIENCNDLFAKDVPLELIKRILGHCGQWPKCRFVFQTKNPKRLVEFLEWIPAYSIVGTTIESNRDFRPIMGESPSPLERREAMKYLKKFRPDLKRFVTIEPILDFDIDELALWMSEIAPKFLNIGADSKGHGLPEPSGEKIASFIEKLRTFGIEVREKHNISRLLGTASPKLPI